MNEDDEIMQIVKDADRRNHLTFLCLDIALIVISVLCIYLFYESQDWFFLLVAGVLISLLVYFFFVLKTHKVFKQ